MKGWISLHRQVMDHWLYKEKRVFSRYEAWLDIVMLASHEDTTFVHGKEVVAVERGEFITSELKLMERWGWSKSKVRAFLDVLQKDRMLDRKTDSKKTALKVHNYGVYQHFTNHEKTAKDTTVDTAFDTQSINKQINKSIKEEYMPLDDMKHVRITQEQLDKLVVLLGTEEKVMEKLYAFASWILTQPKKKQESASAYLSIISWNKRDLNKPIPSIHQPVQNYSYSAKDREAEMMLKAASDAKKAQASGIDFEPRTD